MPTSRHCHQHQHQRLSTLATAAAAAATAAALLLLARVSSAAHMYAPRRQGPAFAGSWLRAPHSAAARSSRSTLAAAAASVTAHARRRPSSLGFLSAVTMLATPRGGWATTSTGGGIPTAPAATAGFCPAPLSTSATSSQTCLAASATSSSAASGTTTVAAPVSATAKKTLQPKYRLSYRQPDYWIRHTDLTFLIEADPEDPKGEATITYVTSRLTIERNLDSNGNSPAPPNLELDGEELELLEIKVDGAALPWDGKAFVVTADQDLLVFGETLASAAKDATKFTLETKVRIRPDTNFELSGFYRSGSAYCTQCEAEGFRRITYYLDRPDVMARFRVRIEADKAKLPLLLSNGNRLETGELGNGRHYAVWEDPFPKPAYLFAVVAGDLGSITDTFTTASGRKVHLEIFSEHENVDKLEHAMASLQRSMKWDEVVFGLEYDLDIYNIVAVNDFNMGAMENKGLNVFNTAFVLARPETATDTDYERIEGVIAHEYFHNWTGNRVTCRDWFQLTLKEGLTVFRDQQYSADIGSAAVKRIEDVRVLRARQFSEDSGPRAHCIRPESYMKMDNFYTATVYEKGAEVIRMYHTLLGAEGFRKGMDLYFSRHDGQAVTCDDFRAAMADATGLDLTQFERWYAQAGTPVVEATTTYDAAAKRFSLTLKQSTPPTVGQPTKLPFHIPVRVGLLAKANGAEIVGSTVLELKETEQTFHFDNVATEPVPSILRGFSAPVRLRLPGQTEEELAFLMAHDTDPFNRWEASQQLASKAILAATDAIVEGKQPAPLAPTTVAAFRAVLQAGLSDPSIDRSLLAYALSLPEELTLLGEMAVMRPVALHAARDHVRRSLAQALTPELEAVYAALDVKDAPYEVTPAEIGRRRLKNVCLSYLSTAKDDAAAARAFAAFRSANCMTDSLAALACLASLPGPQKEEALAAFYEKANGDPLVLNKWFSIQALADLPDAIDRVVALTQHKDFSLKNPNRFRALIGAFANSNLAHFHAADGRGYELVGDMVLEVDKINPQVAARLAGAFSLWRKFEAERRNLMKEQLDRLMAAGDALSRDTYEIVSQSLVGGS